MKRVTIARLLRERYGVTARELAEMAGVSQQYISDLELGKYNEHYDYKNGGAPLMLKAFEGVAAYRATQARRLSEDLSKYRCRLLDLVEESDEL